LTGENRICRPYGVRRSEYSLGAREVQRNPRRLCRRKKKRASKYRFKITVNYTFLMKIPQTKACVVELAPRISDEYTLTNLRTHELDTVGGWKLSKISGGISVHLVCAYGERWA
jgi:hypothetical protein